jgi:hypothetical protein
MDIEEAPGLTQEFKEAPSLNFIQSPAEQDILDRQTEVAKFSRPMMAVLDTLQTGQYISANIAKAILDDKWDIARSAWRGLSQEEKGSFIDVLQKHEVPFSTALGLVLDIGLDPTTWIPFGTLAKPIKMLKEVEPIGKVVEKISKVPPFKTLGKAFIPGYNLPPKYYETKQLSKYMLQAKERDVVGKIEELANHLPKEDRELLSIVRQDPSKVSELTSFQRDKLAEIARSFEALGEEAVAEKLITRESFDYWKDTYLPGFYPGKTKLAVGEIPPSLFEKTRQPTFTKQKKFTSIQEAEDYSRTFNRPDLAPEKDILKLLGTRSIEQVRFLARKHFVDDVIREFGERVPSNEIKQITDTGVILQKSNQPAVIKEGMGVYYPKGQLRFFSLKYLTPDWIEDLTSMAEKLKKLRVETEKVTTTFTKEEAILKGAGAASKGPRAQMEKIVRDALQSRGFTEGESNAYIHILSTKGAEGVEDVVKRVTEKQDTIRVMLSSKELEGELIDVSKLASLNIQDIGAITSRVPAYLLPREIANDMNKVQKFFWGDESARGILQVYDKLLGTWKSLATSFRWPFHVRNAMSNEFLIWLGGVSAEHIPIRNAQALAIATGRAGDVATKSGQKISYDAVRELANTMGIRGHGWVGQEISVDAYRSLSDMLDKGLPSKILEWAPDKSRAFGKAVEDNARLSLFVDQLAKGKSPQEARQQVAKYLFNYDELTPFEKNVMKRVFPFYTWMRKNSVLQITSILEQPGKYAMVGKSLDALEKQIPQTTEEKELKPEYMIDMSYFKTPWKSKEGSPIYAYVDLPYTDLNRMFNLRDIVSSVSPAKVIYELMANQRNFPDLGNKIEAFKGRLVPAPIWVTYFPDVVKRWLGVEPMYDPDNPSKLIIGMRAKWKHALDVAFPVLSEMGRMNPQPVTLEDEKQPWRVLSYLTGTKFTPLNLEEKRKWQYIDLREAYKRIYSKQAQIPRKLTEQEMRELIFEK